MPLRPPAVRFARAAIGPSPRPHILERKGFVTSCHRTVHTLGSRRQPSALRTRVARTHPGGRAAMSSEPCPDSLPPAGGPAGDRPATKGDAITNARNERRWNRLADGMSRFHDYFKAEFNAIYEMADGSFSKRGMNLRMYLSEAGELRKHLTVHHTIEERHIFPVLAKRMPEFQNDEKHIQSHHAIHEGLDKLGELISKWLAEPSTYSPQEMRDSLDSWREVLFKHLDEEVRDLSAENMKKYWKLEEVDRIIM